MFYHCESITSLPDISKWDFFNVEIMGEISGLFEGCYSLISLPDISKWNTANVTNIIIEEMFSKCYSLISLPDIQKWNLSKVNSDIDIFDTTDDYINLLNLPNKC